MFHVPGKYSGAEAEGFSWTQTLQEIELRAPVPKGPPERSVRCSFLARKIDLAFVEVSTTTETPVVSGEPFAVLAASDCMWSVERSDAGDAIAVVSLRKTVPKLWPKLLATDPDAAAPPSLLDGQERSQPKSRTELLKDAKERVGKELDGPSKAKQFAVEALADAERTLSRADLPELPVLVIRGCTGSTITLASDAIAIKLQVERCKNCTIDVRGRVLTETLEAWECDDCKLLLGSKSRTVQLDRVSNLDLAFLSVEFFDRIMHTGVRRSRVAFLDAPQLATTIDLDALQAERPDMTLDEATDQFITRRVAPGNGAAADGGGAAAAAADSLSTELVIRLCNDFPTTEREVRDFEQRTRLHEEKLDEVVDGMLGSSLGKTLTQAEKEQMKGMMREQSAAASAAQQQAEQTSEGRLQARVTFKKNEGNAAFKANEFQQAAVLYTEALSLDDTQHALYSNRAACFLKLGRYSQALEDAQKCTELNPTFAKGHFRLGLALQAENRPAEACAAFNRVLELEPSNKEAASGLNMARMQAERQRRQEAGQVSIN